MGPCGEQGLYKPGNMEDCRPSQEARREARNRPFARAFRRNQTCQHCDFWTSSLLNGKRMSFCCLQPPSVYFLLQESNTPLLRWMKNSERASAYTMVLSNSGSLRSPWCRTSAFTISSSPPGVPMPSLFGFSGQACLSWGCDSGQSDSWPHAEARQHLIIRQNVVQFHPWTALKARPLLG